MSSPRTEFDLLLEAPDSFVAEMASEVLSQAGIPTYMHGRDRDLAELGHVLHNSLTRPDLYVPKGSLEKARAILEAAWDKSALSDEIALATPMEDEEPRRLQPRSRRRLWMSLIFAALVVAVFVLYYEDFVVSHRGVVP
jgi:hypothetical protein